MQSRNKSTQDEPSFHFPLTAFVAVFGGPGLHGYGQHNISNESSQVTIDSLEGIAELVGQAKVAKLALEDPIQMIVRYHRRKEVAAVSITQSSMPTLMSLWSKNTSACQVPNNIDKEVKRRKIESLSREETQECITWTCRVCTFIHDKSKYHYLVCQICGTERNPCAAG